MLQATKGLCAVGVDMHIKTAEATLAILCAHLRLSSRVAQAVAYLVRLLR
jgi:hypothetical protein